MNKAVRDWFENPEIFKRRLGEGQKWEREVACRIAALGYKVEIPEAVEYTGWRDAHKHANSHDLLCEGRIVEVKSRGLKFTSAQDFPYDTVIVDTVHGFNQKTDKPFLYVCVSQKTGGMIGLDVELTRGLWEQKRSFDTTARIPTTNYVAAKGLWGPVPELLEKLVTRSV